MLYYTELLAYTHASFGFHGAMKLYSGIYGKKLLNFFTVDFISKKKIKETKPQDAQNLF